MGDMLESGIHLEMRKSDTELYYNKIRKMLVDLRNISVLEGRQILKELLSEIKIKYPLLVNIDKIDKIDKMLFGKEWKLHSWW